MYRSFLIIGSIHTSVQSHICILQTAIDLLQEGKKVFVIADGVSSCNKEEIPIAFDRIRQAGGQITTSESFLFQYIGKFHVSVPLGRWQCNP